jgi:hypothetical protein
MCILKAYDKLLKIRTSDSIKKSTILDLFIGSTNINNKNIIELIFFAID